MTKKKRKRIFINNWLWAGNGPKTKNILNNITSKESDKMLVAMQSLGMSESTIKRIHIEQMNIFQEKNDQEEID